jgi:hypothetical protein
VTYGLPTKQGAAVLLNNGGLAILSGCFIADPEPWDLYEVGHYQYRESLSYHEVSELDPKVVRAE